MSNIHNILTISNLQVVSSLGQTPTPILNGLSFCIPKGEVVGLMGSSGSGKSTLAYTLANILQPPRHHSQGEIQFHFGSEKAPVTPLELTGQLSMIFQAPYKSLNPLMTCGAHLIECINIHQATHKQEVKSVKSIATEYLAKVHLPSEVFDKYPHQLSGGQIQRVMIALALSQQAEFMIADEPTASLDVHTELEVLQLMKNLQQSEGFSLLLITHDLTHIKNFADRILILDQGVLVEDQAVQEFVKGPQSQTGKSLLESAHLLEPPPSTNRLQDSKPMLSGKEVSVMYESRKNPFSKPVLTEALSSASFELSQGNCLGILGVSGSGKSSLVKALKGMVPMKEGEVHLYEPPITYSHTDKKPSFRFHSEIQLISQLNEELFDPRQKIFTGLQQVYQLHKKRNALSWEDCLSTYLEQLGLSSELLDRYPHQVSGGQLQRTNILRALLVNPSILICDEILSQLDMPIKAQILIFLQSWVKTEKRSLLFISHDIREIHFLSQYVMVMHEGEIIEENPTEELIANPIHPQTQLLLSLRK